MQALRKLVLFSAFACALSAQTFVSSADLGNATSASSLTASFTVSANSNRLLFVAVEGDNVSDVVSGVTYAGSAMTQITKVQGHRWAYLYCLAAPTTGANNVVVSRSTTGDLYVGAIEFSGAQQSCTMDATATNTATASNLDLSLTAGSGKKAVMFVVGYVANHLPVSQIDTTVSISGSTWTLTSGNRFQSNWVSGGASLRVTGGSGNCSLGNECSAASVTGGNSMTTNVAAGSSGTQPISLANPTCCTIPRLRATEAAFGSWGIYESNGTIDAGTYSARVGWTDTYAGYTTGGLMATFGPAVMPQVKRKRAM